MRKNCSQFFACLSLLGLGLCGISSNLFSVDMMEESSPVKKIGGLSIENNVLVRADHDLTVIRVPDGVTEIAAHAFSDCKRVKEIVLPQGLTKIGREAFFQCMNLTDINIPDTVQTIEEGAFLECRKLKNLDLPEGLNTIGDFAFALSQIEDLTLPKSLRVVGRGAFWGCRRLSNLSILGAPLIGGYAFYECHRLSRVLVNSEAQKAIYEAQDNLFTRRHIEFRIEKDMDLVPVESNPTLQEVIEVTVDTPVEGSIETQETDVKKTDVTNAQTDIVAER